MPAYRCLIGPLYSRFERDFPIDLRVYLKEAMSVSVKNARFIPQVRSGVWDGRIKFFREVSASFYTGLLFWVEELLAEAEHPATVEYVYEKMPVLKPHTVELKQIVDPRDYQEPIIAEAIERKRGIVQAAVNAGKSVIAAEIIRRLRLRTLYLVPSKDLFEQFYTDAKKFLPQIPIGQLKGGEKGSPPIFAPGLLTVAMFQSLVRRIQEEDRTVLSWLANIECIIGDEIHKAGAEKFILPFKEAKNAQYRYGFSATPLGMGEVRDLTLQGVTGPLFGKITRKELVAKGYSVDTIVRFLSYEPRGTLDQDYSRREWHDIYRLGIEENVRRAKATWKTAYEHLKKGQRVAVLVDTTDHGDFLCQLLRLEARRARMPEPRVLYGPDSMATRKHVLGLFKSRKHPLLITTLLKEGVNIPEIEILFNAGGKKAANAVIQHGGRVHRTMKGKDLAYIYDYIDASHEMLLDHTAERHHAYVDDAYKIELITVEI